MLRRLAGLGIDKRDPNELTPEERARFVRLDIDPGGCACGAAEGVEVAAQQALQDPLHSVAEDWLLGLGCRPQQCPTSIAFPPPPTADTITWRRVMDTNVSHPSFLGM